MDGVTFTLTLVIADIQRHRRGNAAARSPVRAVDVFVDAENGNDVRRELRLIPANPGTDLTRYLRERFAERHLFGIARARRERGAGKQTRAEHEQPSCHQLLTATVESGSSPRAGRGAMRMMSCVTTNS